MKPLNFSLACTLLVFVIASCKKEVFGLIKGDGPSVTENREISGFNKIEQNLDAELFYVQDSVYRVSVYAQQNIQQVIQTEVNDGTLKVYTKKTILKHNPIKIYVHSPEIYALTINGSGSIKAQQSISTSSIEFRLSGSGNISLQQLNAQNADARISGSGNLNISSGTLASDNILVSGSGNADFLNLITDQCSAQTSGSGNISVNVVQLLQVKISGSGNIKYKGNPGVDASISGSGQLIHIN